MFQFNAVLGVVAEYNPLHDGHRLMLEAARAALGQDAPCVVALSPAFTQRGTPALVDKWTRARMALACGADLVLELPFLFACAAAPDFSAGAVDLLAGTGLATHIAFGMESPERDVESILEILTREPPAFKDRLREELGRGASYPKAVSEALESLIPGSRAFASAPNNLLALSYLLRIRRRGYGLRALPIARRGGGHGDTELGPLASSGAIRAALRDGAALDRVAGALPAPSLALLREAREAGRLCAPLQAEERLWTMLRALFLRSSPQELRRVSGVEEGIENLFLRQWREASGLEDFIGRCVSARCTRGRVRRCLIRLLTGVDRWDAQAVVRAGVPYARVLGFSERGRELLKGKKAASKIPIITRLAAAKGPIGRLAAQMEFRASWLFELLLEEPDLRHEERQRPCGLK